MAGLKINLDALESDGEDIVDTLQEGVRLGGLTVSTEGLTTSMGQKYVLSPDDVLVNNDKFLGRGSSGSVRQATHRKTGREIALKEIKLSGHAHLMEIRRELETLHRGGRPSPYLVDFYGAYCYEGSVFIAMECMDGSLDSVSGCVPADVLECITRSILRGMLYLHKDRHLIHRDIKPSNILYSLDGSVKFSDFGASSCLEYTRENALSFIGTLTYMSPERLKGEPYSFSADVWSLGLVVAELALGKCPFIDRLSRTNGSTEGRFWVLLQHLSGDWPVITLPSSMSSSMADFITACTQKEPSKRPTCEELCRHPFVALGEEESDKEIIRQWLSTVKTKAEMDGSRRLFGVCPVLQAMCDSGATDEPLNLDEELSRLVQ
uniref:mitogen-activated protein kinase kinase n=1 Tax=Trypanosoma congolense (strain IL3000) TaxID=1068625 RepID=G0UWB2_TRYCI|nr:putative MAP kinase kinase [Trypanosoma congolense IL3000]